MIIKPEMSFSHVAPLWLESHKCYIKERTFRDYLQYVNALNEYFAAQPLESITIERVRGFQAWRSKTVCGDGPESKYRHSAGNVRIKSEINSVLKPLLREAGLWHQVKEKKFKHLPVSRLGSGMSLNPDEVTFLLKIAFSRVKWRTCAHCLQLMFNTGCGFGELRHVRRRDIDLEENMISISEDGAKNQARIREVPLTADALQSVEYLLARWQRLGGKDDSEFILPHRDELGQGRANFTRPMVSVNNAWIAIRNAAAVAALEQNDPKLAAKVKRFRIYDCRVTAITRALSSGAVSLLTAERLFGHVSIQMQRRYFKPELDVLRSAVDVLKTSPQT